MQSSNSSEESDQLSHKLRGKKRGRKMTELAKYFCESEGKIKNWKEKLKNDKGLTSKEK